MELKQLMWIKKIQKEHQVLFSAPLIVDFGRMNGNKIIRRDFDEIKVKKWLHYYITQNDIDLEIVKNNRITKNKFNKEWMFIKDYVNFLKKEEYNYTKGAEFIGKDRTTLRWHINIR